MPDLDLDALASLYLLRHVPRQDLKAFMELAERVVLRSGQLVFKAGAPANHALLVVTGRLQASVGAGESREVLGDIRSGEVVGETALLDPGGTRQVDVRAVEDSVALVLTAQVLARGRHNRAVIALQHHLVATLARRIRSANLHLQQRWRVLSTAPSPPPELGFLDRVRAFFGSA